MSQTITTLVAVRGKLVEYIEDAISGVENAPAVERDDPRLAEGGGCRLGISTGRLRELDVQISVDQPIYQLEQAFTIVLQDFDEVAATREALPDALRAAIGVVLGTAPWLDGYHGYVRPGEVELDTDVTGDSEVEHLQVIQLAVEFLSYSPIG
jgi:hypothetical protein